MPESLANHRAVRRAQLQKRRAETVRERDELLPLLRQAEDELSLIDKQLEELGDEVTPAPPKVFETKKGKYAEGMSMPDAIEDWASGLAIGEAFTAREAWNAIVGEGYKSSSKTPDRSARTNLMKRANAKWSKIFLLPDNRFIHADRMTEAQKQECGGAEAEAPKPALSKKIDKTTRGIQEVRDRGARWGGAPAFTKEGWDWAVALFRAEPNMKNTEFLRRFERDYRGPGRKKLSEGTARNHRERLLRGESYPWPEWVSNHPAALEFPGEPGWQAVMPKPAPQMGPFEVIEGGGAMRRRDA